MDIKPKKTKIVFKFLATYALLSLSLIFILAILMNSIFTNFAFESIRKEAKTVAENAAQEISGDDHSKLMTVNDMNSSIYNDIHNYLSNYPIANPSIEYIYTLKPTWKSINEWEFVIDAEEDGEPIGTQYDVSNCPEVINALSKSSADKVITTDKWGSWISGYAPVKDQFGASVAIVGVDISAERYYSMENTVKKVLAIFVLVSLILSIIFGFIGFIIFNSENKKIMRLLEIRSTDLRSEVKKRTSTIEAFVAMVVHDLRAPLVSFKWGIETLKDNPKKKQREEFLDEMAIRVDTMLFRVSDLLDVSKLETSKISLEKKKWSLLVVVRSVVKEFKPLAEEKGLKITTSLHQDVPQISFDKQRIYQVLENLISNSIKYTENGNIKVSVRLLKGGEKVRVEISDTGIGMLKRELEDIFTPFTSFARGRKKRMSTGLGLSIAKGIIDAHNGRIGVESKEKKGSTFWFELPL